ncbi:hypothetical protein G9A89_000234 [Geosiphon pyriformis]|nr:hypothetical protein G9A89_000234 [Geosiphon pyriformis]
MRHDPIAIQDFADPQRKGALLYSASMGWYLGLGTFVYWWSKGIGGLVLFGFVPQGLVVGDPLVTGLMGTWGCLVIGYHLFESHIGLGSDQLGRGLNYPLRISIFSAPLDSIKDGSYYWRGIMPGWGLSGWCILGIVSGMGLVVVFWGRGYKNLQPFGVVLQVDPISKPLYPYPQFVPGPIPMTTFVPLHLTWGPSPRFFWCSYPLSRPTSTRLIGVGDPIYFVWGLRALNHAKANCEMDPVSGCQIYCDSVISTAIYALWGIYGWTTLLTIRGLGLDTRPLLVPSKSNSHLISRQGHGYKALVG